ncbi:MAG: cohesin domain-containing protein, partial [Acidobacteria bacterium]|nr:cohesin domain-containing protein [Acidobacteriota bacterium]
TVPAAPTPALAPDAPPAPTDVPDDGAEAPSDEPEGGEEAETAEAQDEPPKRQAVAQLRLGLSRAQAAPGDSVAVDVVIAGAENVGMVNFQLRYDKKVLRFVPPAQPGEFMQQGGAAYDLQAVEAAEGGTIVVSASRGGSAGASGTGSLVRLSFIALDQGNAGFGFAAAQVRGPDAQPMPASFRVANLDVKKP